MNKKHLQEQAKTLYTQGLQSFLDIAKTLNISERTVRTWAKKGNWNDQRQDFLNKTDGLLSDRIEIANLLGAKIKDLLKKQREPSAALLNAYRGITEGLNKVKQFEDGEKPQADGTKDISLLTKQAIKNTF